MNDRDRWTLEFNEVAEVLERRTRAVRDLGEIAGYESWIGIEARLNGMVKDVSRLAELAAALRSDAFPGKGTVVADSFGRRLGTATGANKRCQLEGCRGRRIAVRWGDARVTHPCTRGMEALADGSWKIL